MSIIDLLTQYKNLMASPESIKWICFKVYLAKHDPFTNYEKYFQTNEEEKLERKILTSRPKTSWPRKLLMKSVDD